MISELKIDSFPHNHFFIEGFISTPYTLDRDSNGGRILGGYFFQLNCNRKQTNRKFLCRAKLA